MVCNEHSAHFCVLEIFLQLAYVVKEARGLNDNSLAVLLYDENLVVNEIVGLVCVELYCAEVVNVHFTLGELDCRKCVLIHGMYLLKNMRLIYTKHQLKTIQKIEHNLAYMDYAMIFCL